MHFQNLQDRHRLCIFNITLFAYDFLFEQQRNSHDEYLVNKNLLNKKDHLKWKNTSNQGARHDHCPSSGAVQSRFGESLKSQISWGKSPHEPLGALQQRILHDQTPSGNMATQAARGTSLHSKNMDIVEKILRIIKDPLG